MFKILALLFVFGSAIAANAVAQIDAGERIPRQQALSEIPPLLPRSQEVDLALAAAPPSLRPGAGVYVLERHGFVKVRESSNGFTCIVNRDLPPNQKPTCYDAEGTATILPKVIEIGNMFMAGTPVKDVYARIQAEFKSGKLQSPRRPGVAYMLSGDIKNYNPNTETITSFPPHVMFYAPNLTDKDIGSDGTFDYGLPSIGYQGPQGYMIVVCGEYCGISP